MSEHPPSESEQPLSDHDLLVKIAASVDDLCDCLRAVYDRVDQVCGIVQDLSGRDPHDD